MTTTAGPGEDDAEGDTGWRDSSEWTDSSSGWTDSAADGEGWQPPPELIYIHDTVLETLPRLRESMPDSTDPHHSHGHERARDASASCCAQVRDSAQKMIMAHLKRFLARGTDRRHQE
jgi:hypothetical protein